MSDRAQQQQEQMPQGGGGGGNTPPGQEVMVFGPWTGTNTNGSRPGIKDEELYFTDNFMPVGPGRLRTLPDIGPALFTTISGTVVFFDFFNIGFTPYCLVLTNDGSLSVFVTSPAGAATTIAPPGTITTPAQNAIGITQWGSRYLLIAALQTDGYFIWDGTTFYNPGDAVPGFTTVPTGVGGTAIEIYQQHVWIANGATILFSAPQSITDFATADGGGSFTSVDSFLRIGYINLKSTNGFLYLIGDSSINYISGVATGGGPPPVTTFTNQNADPEVGSPWANTVDVLTSNIVMANWWGVHVSYGGRVNKISEPMDGVFLNAAFPGGFVPSACKAILYGKRVWCLLIPVLNTITGASSNMLMMYSQEGQSGRWWLAHQSVTLTYVAHEEIQSLITGYGTDGTSIYKLFNAISSSLSKSFQTKMKFSREGYITILAASRLWGLAEIFSVASASLSVGIDNESSSTATTLALPGTATTGALVSVPAVTPVGQQGTLIGLTVTTNAADISIISLSVGTDVWSYKG